LADWDALFLPEMRRFKAGTLALQPILVRSSSPMNEMHQTNE
jgi:hypothetical protein